MRIILSQKNISIFWNYPIIQLSNQLIIWQKKVVPLTFINILVKYRTFYDDQNSRYLENKKSG